MNNTETMSGENIFTQANEVCIKIENILEKQDSIIYTADNLDAAKRERRELNRLRASLENYKNILKDTSSEEYSIIERKYRTLNRQISKQLRLMTEFIEFESQNLVKLRRRELKQFYNSKAKKLGKLAEIVWNSPCFFSKNWDNIGMSTKAVRREILDKINSITKDLALIRDSTGEYAPALMLKYIETLSLAGLEKYREELDSASKALLPSEPDEDRIKGSRTIKLNGTRSEIDRATMHINVSGVTYTIIEDNMPHPVDITGECDFDSFVAFDLEISGSYGVLSGDKPAEIIEFGAVKVVDGAITEHFSELCNPGRSIVPVVTELTGIDNEMIKDKPSVGEMFKRFLDFAGGEVLVGHGISDSDMIYLERASRKAGIPFENRYVDTFSFAKLLGGLDRFEGLGLESLANQLKVPKNEAHRALSDAQTAAMVFLALKDINKGK